MPPIQDFSESCELGASRILIPMVESLYALKIGVHNYNEACSSFRSHTYSPRLFTNLETTTAVSVAPLLADHILANKPPLSGIVIGRSDLASSLSITDVDSPELLDFSMNLLNIFLPLGISITLGGAITSKSYEFISKLYDHGLTAYETRKCTINLDEGLSFSVFNSTIHKCLEFELMWLQHKLSLSHEANSSDLCRINILKERLDASL